MLYLPYKHWTSCEKIPHIENQQIKLLDTIMDEGDFSLLHDTIKFKYTSNVLYMCHVILVSACTYIYMYCTCTLHIEMY